LNCASKNGLTSDKCGREWDWVTPRSASRNATGFEVIDEPRSVCRVSYRGEDELSGANATGLQRLEGGTGL
jgi:hypothetical protein